MNIRLRIIDEGLDRCLKGLSSAVGSTVELTRVQQAISCVINSWSSADIEYLKTTVNEVVRQMIQDRTIDLSKFTTNVYVGKNMSYVIKFAAENWSMRRWPQSADINKLFHMSYCDELYSYYFIKLVMEVMKGDYRETTFTRALINETDQDAADRFFDLYIVVKKL